MDGLFTGSLVVTIISMAILGIIILCKRGTDDTQGVELALEETLDRRRPIQPFISEESSRALDEAIQGSREARGYFND